MDSVSSIEYIWFLEILTELVDKWGEILATTQILDLCETAQNTNYFPHTAKDKTWILVWWITLYLCNTVLLQYWNFNFQNAFKDLFCNCSLLQRI